jgi:NADH dehydrogenase
MRSNDAPNHRPKVVIVGGGFGGLACQNALRNSMPNADVTIVEPNERFTFLPLLYEYLGGLADLDEISPTYEYLLSSLDFPLTPPNKASSSVLSLERGSAVEVDAKKKLLHIRRLPSGESTSLRYDALVVSCGLPPSTPKANRPTIPSSAFSFATLDDAVRLKRRLGAPSSQGDSIVVVGGGYVGTELACTLSKIVPGETKLTVLHRDATGVCTGAEASNREEAQRRLEALGVNLKLGSTVENVTLQTLDGETFDDVQYTTTNGDVESIRADVLIWTVSGATKKPRQVVKGLPVDGRGRVVVSPTCQVQGMERVYAIGDGAVVVSESPGSDTHSSAASPYPATAQVAMQQAQVAAHNLQVNLENKGIQKEFQYLSLGEMLSLGGDEDASISSLNGLFTLNGPLASAARRLVYAARMPTPKQAVRSGAGYVVGGLARGVGGLATEIKEKCVR